MMLILRLEKVFSGMRQPRFHPPTRENVVLGTLSRACPAYFSEGFFVVAVENPPADGKNSM
jgi:hypothetical protein